MNKVLMTSVVAGVGLVIASVAGYRWWSVQQAPEHDLRPGSSIPFASPRLVAPSANALSSPLQMQSLNPVSSQSVVESTSQTNTAAEPKSGPDAWLGPDDFAKYEQYKTSSQVWYVDEQVGSGSVARSGQQVSVDYRGWLTNGHEFDESYARGQQFDFQLGQRSVIAGWDQGISGMRVGGKRRLIVPPALGYGSAGTNGVPPGAVLVFDVELHRVR